MCPAFVSRRRGRWPRWVPRSTPKRARDLEGRHPTRVLWIVDCVKRLGSTAVAITHDMASARRIGDTAAMLYQGRIVWHGPAGQLMDSGNPAVDQFTHGRREGPISMALRRCDVVWRRVGCRVCVDGPLGARG